MKREEVGSDIFHVVKVLEPMSPRVLGVLCLLLALHVHKAFSFRVAQHVSSFTLADHQDAVFMSVVPVPNSDTYVAFYRTGYNTYVTGVAIMNASMAVVLDLGAHIGGCEDPRTFWWNDRLYVMDNHGWVKRKIFDVMAGEAVQVQLPTTAFQGKNWVPFVVNGILYFAFHLEPLCLLKCHKMGTVLDCQEVQKGCTAQRPSKWRGGSSGFVRDGWVVGAGHITVNGSYHRPFLFKFSVNAMENENTDTHKEMLTLLGGDSHNYGIIDPTALIPGPPLRMLVTESRKEWFSPGGYRFSWYDISE